jgi:lactoylglutathione lyase
MRVGRSDTGRPRPRAVFLRVKVPALSVVAVGTSRTSHPDQRTQRSEPASTGDSADTVCAMARIDYVIQYVESLTGSTAFYRDAIGLEVRKEGDGYVEFDMDNTKFSLFERAKLQGLIGHMGGTAPCGEIGFVIDDVDAEAARLKGLGVRILRGPTDRHLSDESCLGATVPAAETVVPMCKIESKAMSPAHRAKLGGYLMVGLEEDERNGSGTSTSRDQRNTAHGGDPTACPPPWPANDARGSLRSSSMVPSAFSMRTLSRSKIKPLP